jgi:hypothetical protein
MWAAPELRWLHVWDNRRTSHRMLKISLPQGCSKRRGEVRTLRTLSALSAARTTPADLFGILLSRSWRNGQRDCECRTVAHVAFHVDPAPV